MMIGIVVVFLKQKTAYEMRISDWSSDVCSSDLVVGSLERELTVELRPEALEAAGVSVAQVVQALGLQNLAAPVGRVTGNLQERSIRLMGRLDRKRVV